VVVAAQGSYFGTTPHTDEDGVFLLPDTLFADVMLELSGQKDSGKPYDFTVVGTQTHS